MGAQRWSQPLIVQSVTDGPTLTAAAAASCIPTPNKITLPNNYWEVGRQWRVSLHGRISTVVTTPGTARFDLRIGAVVAFDSLAIALDAVAGYTTVPWWLEIMLTCRAAGAGTVTQLLGVGKWTSPNIAGAIAGAPKGSLTALLPWNAAPALGTGFDNTLANTVDMFFTQTVATGSLTVHGYQIEELN